MVKRYEGNSGRVRRVEERPAPPAAPEPPGRPSQAPPPGPVPLPRQLQRLLSGSLGELETEDLLLLLILYLLDRESGDRDWLLTLGAMLFL